MSRAKRPGPENGEADDYKSRSQKKRESSADQKLGEELAALAPSQVRAFELAPDLETAIIEWKGLKTHEARRRQMQFIGRLMREEDSARIAERLDELLLPSRRETESLHRTEIVRDVLVAAAEQDDDAPLENELEKLALCLPRAEIPRVRHLARSAAAERAKGKAPRAYRELFRLLRVLDENDPE